MRTVGIIAEYNPFHTGHAYHIRKAKEVSEADYAVAVMSPDFVQRGEPAIFDKYVRVKMALLNGADLVVELPVCYATGSAEYFAEGAVRMLDQLGVVDTLCFGAESADDAQAFQKAAEFLLEEPETYRASLRTGLRNGLTYPQARSAAVSACGHAEMSGRLSFPNNILGVEYCRALLKSHSPITPVPIERKSSGYLSHALDGAYCSAGAIRSAIEGGCERCGGKNGQSISKPCDELYRSLSRYIPEKSANLFRDICQQPVFADDLLPMLGQKLIFRDRFDDILDISVDLSDRIRSLRYVCIGKTFAEIAALLKTRQLTEARVRRALLHLVLGINKDSTEYFRSEGTVFYAHVLGFRQSAAPLLHEIKKRSALPFLTKAAHISKYVSGSGLQMWEQDIAASHLYRSIRTAHYGVPFQSEYEISPVISS